MLESSCTHWYSPAAIPVGDLQRKVCPSDCRQRPWPMSAEESLGLKRKRKILGPARCILRIRRLLVGVHWLVSLHLPDYIERYHTILDVGSEEAFIITQIHEYMKKYYLYILYSNFKTSIEMLTYYNISMKMVFVSLLYY
jgi:hypothetical protein